MTQSLLKSKVVGQLFSSYWFPDTRMEIPLCWTRTTRPTRQFIPVEILELLVREQTMSQAVIWHTHTLKLIYLHFCIKKNQWWPYPVTNKRKLLDRWVTDNLMSIVDKSTNIILHFWTDRCLSYLLTKQVTNSDLVNKRRDKSIHYYKTLGTTVCLHTLRKFQLQRVEQ